MKKIIAILASFIFVIMLSGCGADGSTGAGGGGDAAGYAGGGNGAGMGSADGLPVGNLMAGDGSMSMDGSMDVGALMGGLTGGGSDDDDDDDDDSSDDDSSDDSATNNGAAQYPVLGNVVITFQGVEYPLAAVVLPATKSDLAPTAYLVDERGENVTIQIAAYDVKEDRLNLDTGSLVFSFSMPIIVEDDKRYLEEGTFPLLTPDNRSGDVEVRDVRTMNDNRVKVEAVIANAELYSSDRESVFEVSIAFDVWVNPLPAQ